MAISLDGAPEHQVDTHEQRHRRQSEFGSKQDDEDAGDHGQRSERKPPPALGRIGPYESGDRQSDAGKEKIDAKNDGDRHQALGWLDKNDQRRDEVDHPDQQRHPPGAQQGLLIRSATRAGRPGVNRQHGIGHGASVHSVWVNGRHPRGVTVIVGPTAACARSIMRASLIMAQPRAVSGTAIRAPMIPARMPPTVTAPSVAIGCRLTSWW